MKKKNENNDDDHHYFVLFLFQFCLTCMQFCNLIQMMMMIIIIECLVNLWISILGRNHAKISTQKKQNKKSVLVFSNSDFDRILHSVSLSVLSIFINKIFTFFSGVTAKKQKTNVQKSSHKCWNHFYTIQNLECIFISRIFEKFVQLSDKVFLLLLLLLSSQWLLSIKFIISYSLCLIVCNSNKSQDKNSI